MGVSVLYSYPSCENKTGAQVIDNLNKRLLAMGAIHTGQFLVDCESYVSAPLVGPSKMVHIIHNSEYPVTTFSVLDSNNGKHIPLIADNIFDLVLIKMTAVNPNKKQTRIESKGARFEYGDFVIKLGSVTIMENFKGILIEVEYRACVIFSLCWEMIREMMESFLGMPIPKEYPHYFATQHMYNSILHQQTYNKQNETYEIIDTVYQYLEHFTNYRKHSTLSQNQTSTPQAPIVMNPGMRNT